MRSFASFKQRFIWILIVLIIAVSGTITYILLQNQTHSSVNGEEQLKVVEKKHTPKDLTVDFSLGEDYFKVVEQESEQLTDGVLHTRLSLEGTGNLEGQLQAVNVLAIDPSQPGITIEFVSPGEKVLMKQTVTEIAKGSETEKKKAIGAFNVDFFDMSNGMPRGLQITNREIVTATKQALNLLAIMPDKSIVIDQGTSVEMVLKTETDEQLEINGVNKVRLDKFSGHAFLLNDTFDTTTRSVGKGIEVVITPNDEQAVLQAGKPFTGTIENIYESNNNAIPEGKLVLTAAGSKAEWVKKHLSPGKTVTFLASFNNELIHEAEHVYAGGDHSLAKTLVVDGEVPVWIARVINSSNTDVHPRTMFAEKDGVLYVFVFDGRRAGYANGISLRDAAYYLAAIGMDFAINADGGGSSTFAARKPGETELSILNRPSDGGQRLVANALVIMQEKE